MNLSGIDLNLLPLLEALLTERHVTRAARRVGLSQPAASRGLARLRGLTGDPLLVRTGRTFVLTPRAEALRDPVRQALGLVEAALRPPEPFDPGTARRTLRIAADDYCLVVVVAPLIQRLSAIAPGLDVWVLPSIGSLDTYIDPLVRGEADVILGPIRVGERRPSGVHAEHVADERFVCVVAEGHALASGATVEGFAAARHAFVAPGGRRGGAVDDALATLGLERRVALSVPQFVVAPVLVAETDLVLTIGERLARRMAAILPLVVFDPPVDLPGFAIGTLWHERDRHDPALGWIRNEVRAVGRMLSAEQRA